jgi:aminoglycoside phosphotransferase (APT) family kinase protein
MGPAFRRIADIYVARAEAIAKLGSAGIGTLVHGDAHLGNLFVNVDGGDRTGFLDWALVCRAPGRRDVACVLCNSIPIDVREANQRALVARYCETPETIEIGEPLLADAGIQTHRVTRGSSTASSRSTRGLRRPRPPA